MRFGVTTVVALILGCGLACWLFGLAFTRPTEAFFTQSIVPLLLAAVGAAILARMSSATAYAVAATMAVPAVLLFTCMFVGVFREGRGMEWGHVAASLLVIAATFGGAIIGRLIASRSRSGGGPSTG